jgi:glutamyl-tRNA synthetase
MPITRLAPSPTGALHLGNARTFLVNWLLARQRGWKILLRIEDLDGPRIKRGAAQLLLDDLRWLGIDWDSGPLYQSQRTALYRDALEQLRRAGRTYACVCSRREVELSASAPHADERIAIYPGTCRDRFSSADEARRQTRRDPATRFRSGAGAIEFVDDFAGPRHFDLAAEIGDFTVAKSDQTPAYQLAVVVDDLDAGVTHVVRGDDLLDSTPRQIQIYQALGRADCIPRWIHLPLIVGADGRRLAKRHGDTRLAHYRESGVSAAAVLALLASWCGMGIRSVDRAGDLLDAFSLDALPKSPIVFTPESEALLRAGGK